VFEVRKPACRRVGAVGLAVSAVLTLGMVAPLTASADPVAQVQAAAAETAGLVIPTADITWRYLEDDTFPSEGASDPLSWTKEAFNDSAWKSAKGTFGGKISNAVQSAAYDSSNTATTKLEMNAPGQEVRVRTYFFRTSFDLTAGQLADVGEFRGKLKYDDGAIVYLNGKEIYRGDVPAGSEGLNYASGETTSLDSGSFTIKPADLIAGKNTVAVEVHNDRSSSSDIWFELSELTSLTVDEMTNKPSRIILTPTEDPETSQYVTFQGAEVADSAGRIQYRPTAGGATKQVSAPLQPKSISNNYGHFSGAITGLKAATKYDYRVNSGGAWSAWQTFETADPAEKKFSYLYYGDAQIGLDSTWPKVVNAAMAKAPDAIGSVHAGDLIDNASNDTQWQNWFGGMKTAAATTNVFAAPGNHEYSGDKLLTSWKAHFEYPQNNPNDSMIGEMAKLAVGDTPVARQYRALFDHWSNFAAETVYFADYQGVRFITLNATRDSTFLTPDLLPTCSTSDCPVNNRSSLWVQYQAAWLDFVLENSKSKWNVVTFHQPVYSTSSGRDEPDLRNQWVPIFEKYNVDLVQMGHDHTYARGFKDTTATGAGGKSNGPVYIVSNAGAKHYALETDAKNVWTNNGATQVQKAANITTYQVVDVAEDKLTYRSYIAEISGTPQFFRDGVRLTDDAYKVGDLWDEFSVYKTDKGQKAVVEAGAAAPEFEDLNAAPQLTTDLPAKTTVQPGDRVKLSVAASAELPLSYKWQLRTASGDWTDVAGATGSSLTLGQIGSEEFGNSYRVQVTAGKKSVTSTATELVDGASAPAFSTDLPATTTALPGDRVELKVKAEAGRSVSYKWQSRSVDGDWADIAGAAGASLNLGRIAADDFGTAYRAVATAGTNSITSSSTVLADGTTAPVFGKDLPAATAVKSGNDLSLTVQASSNVKVDYRWQTLEGAAWVDLAGRTGETLTLRGFRNNGQQFRAVAVAGSHESISAATTVQVSKHASSVKVAGSKLKAGKSPVVQVRATAAGTARVQVKVGSKTWTTTVAVAKNRTQNAAFASALPRKAKGNATITVTFTPNSSDFATAKTVAKVKIKK